MSDEPSIELPDGSPGAVGDAGAGLDRVAGGFERGGAVVARATAAVAGWEGRASVSFHGTAASYSEALGAVNEALIGARVAVRRYETRLEDARVKIRALKQDEQDALERLRTARRQLTQARSRLQAAQQRAATARLAIGSMAGGADPIGLAEQAAAQRDAREAQDDIDRALKKIEREQQEIRELRQKAAREHRDLTQDEHDAATQVRAAADQLPDVTLPGGGASPSAYAGTPFGGVGSPFGAGRSWASAIDRARRDEERFYTSNDFGGGQALDQINQAVRDGRVPPRPANFSAMSPAARARYLYQRTGIHPHEDSPGEPPTRPSPSSACSIRVLRWGESEQKEWLLTPPGAWPASVAAANNKDSARSRTIPTLLAPCEDGSDRISMRSPAVRGNGSRYLPAMSWPTAMGRKLVAAMDTSTPT